MPRAITPPGEALADWLIIARVAQLLGFEKAFAYTEASEVFDEIRRSANAKTGYDLRGIDYEKLRQQPRQWPCAPGETQGKAIRYVSRKVAEDSARGEIHFPTASGRAIFFARPYLPPAEWPDADFPFALTNGRLAHQWHTLTKTGKVESLNKLNPGPFVELHPEDATQLGVESNDLVKVSSRRGFAIYPAVITPNMSPGTCFAPFHWNDLFGENLCLNAATNDACDAISHQPEFKFSAVALAKVSLGSLDYFTREQKQILHGLLADVSKHYQPNGQGVPALSEAAPFTSGQRAHINELLARLCAGDSKIEKQP